MPKNILLDDFLLRKIYKLMVLQFLIIFMSINVSHATENNSDQSRVIAIVKNVEKQIKENSIEKAILKYKNSNAIFIGNYSGMFFVSPLHPELIGKNQFNYKDATGTLVVQEEINKAKAGGGWLKGRWRKNSLTGNYECRKIYILPVDKNYFIGSWYHYTSNKQGTCLI